MFAFLLTIQNISCNSSFVHSIVLLLLLSLSLFALVSHSI